MTISQHPFLIADDCQRIRKNVYALKDFWVNRSSGILPFFTLGAASYLDAKDMVQYTSAIEKYNPLLQHYFSWLYAMLSKQLSAILDIPVDYAEGLSLPGFHIFLANQAFKSPVASIHFDLQYLSVKLPYANIDFDHPISFTCAISLPKSGAGLNYWAITYAEAKGLSKDELDQLKDSKEALYIEYEIGKLVLHKGLILHQIAPSKEVKMGDERITLQGHGLICDGILRLYW